MKKNISVNLQGMIFHVEEDGYELLGQYLAAIKNYFSSYEGHEEIVADIESRIAEIFFSRLNPGKQVITREDVQALITQMGTITDFEMEEPEEKETGSTHHQAPHTSTPTGEQKRLYRDINRKVIAGVAAGIANYLQIDPIWVRLAFVSLVISVPFIGAFTLFGILLYIICWVALPQNDKLPEIPIRKLFRDNVDKKLSGVASGIAIYFGVDVAIVRLLFLISFLCFGTGFLIYIILWVAVPEAKSITERVQMQGNPVTLSSIEESVKNTLNMKDANGQESTLAKFLLFPVRLVSQIIQVLGRLLNPAVGFVGTMVRLFAGIMLMITSGAILVALLVVLVTALSGYAQPGFIELGDAPVAEFFRGIPSWLVWSGFFAALIPTLFFFLLGVGLLAKRFLLRPTVGWTMFGIWLVSLVALASGTAIATRQFQEYGEYTAEQTYPTASFSTLVFNVRESSYAYGRRMNVELEGYNGSDVRIIQTYKAQGINEDNAVRNAKMISYKIVQQDSVLRFDDAFTFKSNAIFRDQHLDIKIQVPEGKTIRFSQGFADKFGHDIMEDEYDSDDLANNTWQMKGGRLVCLTCSVVDSTTGATPNSGKVATLDDDLSILDDDYSGISKIYKVRDFSEVEVGGAYHVRIRQSYRHHVRVTGSEKELDKLQLRVQDGVLKISRDSEVFKLWDMGGSTVLIEVETPDLNSLDLSGAAKAEIVGFAPEHFNLEQSGASEVAMSINSTNLSVDLSGACKAILKGHVDELSIDASGASEVEASQLVSQRAQVDLSGASKSVVNVQEHLGGGASGASVVHYHGAVPSEQVSVSQSGGSEVSRKK